MSKRLTTTLLTLGILLIIAGGRSAMAQSGTTATITAVNVVATSSTNANLSFSYSTSLDPTTIRYQVSYGPTTAYGTSTVPTSFDSAALTTHSQAVTLLGLTQGTSYHFTIKLFSATNEQLAASADRTFTTATSGGNGSLLIIERIRVDCVNTSCNIYFSTSKTATVEARWDTSSQTAFTSYATGTSEGAASSSFRSLHVPAASQAQLLPNTQYHYRLQAVGSANESFTTGDLTFTTSASPSDHVFATGQCSDGGTPPTTVDIGSCLGSLFCSASGTLVSDCTKCGFLCPSGQTCRTGSPNAFCEADRPLTGAPTQCNASSCYDPRGVFITPAPAACVSTWPRCNANTILKVRNDRGCDLWLSCATSLQTDGTSSGPGENLCLNLGACNSLNSNGQCNHFLPLGQCNNDPLRFCNNDTDCQAGGTCNNPDPNAPTKSLQDVTYQTPKDVAKIANLSGNVIAGLDWSEQGGANVIQGNLPWQLMRQIGGDAQIKNGDMEFRAPEVAPWNPVPEGLTPGDSLRLDFEDKDNSSNHILEVEPVTQATTALRCSNNANLSCTSGTVAADCGSATATCGDQTVPVAFSGAATNSFTAAPSEYYYAEARIRGDGGSPVVRMQFGFNGYSAFKVGTTNTYVDVATTAAWQRVTLGPLKGMSGVTKLAFVCADAASCGKFQVDDVVVKPILQINTNPSYIAPTCRLYPKNDSPSCDYASTNGVLYKGWKGYCLEHDSQTGTCLSWWPIDIIKGESSIFGSEKAAGYQDRAPLYFCAESSGDHGNQGISTKIQHFCGTGDCGLTCVIMPNPGFCINYDNGNLAEFTPATGTDTLINKNYIYGMVFTITNSYPGGSTVYSGTYYATPNNNWTFTVNPGTNNFFTLTLVWDANGNLQGYDWHFAEDAASSRGFSATAAFIAKESCSKFVQVVDENGNSAAFASRVGSSVYKVPDLNYGLSTDLSPFGGALQPQADSDDPTAWPILSAELPNYTSIQPPGQARAGSPYACKGNCASVICTVGNSTCLDANGNISPSLVSACQNADIDQDGVGDGQCIGVISTAASAKGTQNFSSTLTTGNSYFAQERIKRLFTQTFGIWSNQRCSNNTALACANDTDCGSGTCTVRANKYLQVNNSSPNTTATFVGWKPPTKICPANPGFQPNVCSSNTQQCTALLKASGSSTTPLTTSPANDAQLKREAVIAAMTNCGLDPVDPATVKTNNGDVNTGKPNNGGTGKIACNGANPDCPTTASSTTLFTTFTLTSACSFSNGKYTCAGNCTSTNTYVNASKPTTSTQSKYLRPAYVAGSQADYCAIPPEVSNVKFTVGTASTATISGGSGSIGIKFNTSADQEQVPLSNIRIDWGDNQDEFAFPYAPRNDLSKPHIFSHTYVVNRGDTSHCATVNGRTTCQFPIKVQVEDSWHWCNDGDVTTTCHTNTLANGKKDSSKWFDTGLKVIVQP